jgi:hypothetical protein
MNPNQDWLKHFFLIIELELLIRSGQGESHRADSIRDDLDWYCLMSESFMKEFIEDLVREHLDRGEMPDDPSVP